MFLKMAEMILILHKMTEQPAFSRYLPIEPSLVDWGFYVLDAGYSKINAGDAYPNPLHPTPYQFTWEKGRRLREFQVVYISKGKGEAQFRDKTVEKLEAGNLFLLYPDELHRYRPDPEIGWEEIFIGFNGEYAQQLMERFFSPEKPILTVGHDEELLAKMHKVIDLMKETPPGYRQMMSGETVSLLARIRALNMRSNKRTRLHEEKMDEARYHLLQHASEEVDLEDLASDLGFSYSRFRTIFKAHTGQSPLQYQLDIRVNRAKDLLRSSTRSVSEIADDLGFGSVYYFSRLFKQRTGKTPSSFQEK